MVVFALRIDPQDRWHHPLANVRAIKRVGRERINVGLAWMFSYVEGLNFQPVS